MSQKSNTCRRCSKTKLAHEFYAQRRNVTGLEGICKQCKRVESAARRFGVDESTVEGLYANTHCMCCGEALPDNKKLSHIHHTQKHGVRGLVCFSCNYVLREEMPTDRVRVLKCIEYMTRNNLLHTVNPQERPIGQDAVPESSETTRCETFYCMQCQRPGLTQEDFHMQKSRRTRPICRDCWNAAWRLRNKFRPLRIKATVCDCCGGQFTKSNKSCVHHVGNKVFGIICNDCNQVTGDGSSAREQQLHACLEFMI